MNIHTRITSGFTLTELLIAIAIMATLAMIVLPNLNSSQGVARDTERVTDVKQIQIAVEEYYNLTASYPETNSWESDLENVENEGVIRSVPQDPSGGSYTYEKGVSCDGISGDADFHIRFEAENPDTFSDSTDVSPYDGTDNVFCVEG